jgi:hypothetical protein
MAPAARGEQGGGRVPPAPVFPTISDRSILEALQVWGGASDARFWESFRPDWRASLRTAWERESRTDEGRVRDDLLRAHVAQARPDPEQVHPSWWIRALKDESPSVQRAVAAQADPSLRTILQRGLGLDPAELQTDHPPHPDALRWALGLWAERIVGDLPHWPADPPVIIAMTRFGPREVIALARATGLAKMALASIEPTLRPRAHARFEAFRRTWSEADPASRSLARHDVRAFASNQRRGAGRLGLITFGRLLATAPPYRTRWALQHLPYAIARSIRPTIKSRGRKLAVWEGIILRIAWDQLADEGRLRALGGFPSEHRGA